MNRLVRNEMMVQINQLTSFDVHVMSYANYNFRQTWRYILFLNVYSPLTEFPTLLSTNLRRYIRYAQL
jgi:hypothetical protein